VPIEITNGNEGPTCAIILASPKRSVAVAQEQAACVGDDVQLSVAVKIGDCQAVAWGGVVLCSLEGAVTLAQQHAHPARILVGHGQIGNVIAVEVRYGHESGPLARLINLCRLERAIAVAQVDAHVALPDDKMTRIELLVKIGRDQV